MTPFEAARRGDLDLLAGLLDADPARVGAPADNGTVLLHLAAERDDVAMVALLLERGAELEVEAAWGQTPFEWAANMNARRAAGALLDAGAARLGLWTAAALGMGAEVEAYFVDGRSPGPADGRRPRPGANLEGWTPDTAFLRGDVISDAFYIACRNGHAPVARFLRKQGASIEARGYFGAPVLHWTAGNGHTDIALWLVAEGADLTLGDPEFGGTAAGWAREFGHDTLADLLQRMEESLPANGPDAGHEPSRAEER